MIEGKDIKLDDGIITINHTTKCECAEITYELVGNILTISTNGDTYEFIQKKGFGGLFGVSSDIKNFLSNIENHTNISKKRIATEREKREENERYMRWIASFENDTYELSSDAPDGYLLKKGEEIALWSSEIDFCQIKTKRVGATAGTTIKLGKGLPPLRLGGVAPIEKEYLAHIDTGRLILSTQKLSFMGSNKSVNIGINKIVDVTVYNDAFEVSKEGVMKKYVFMTNHGKLWAEAIEAMNRRINQ